MLYPPTTTPPLRTADITLAALLHVKGFSVFPSPETERNLPFSLEFHPELEAEIDRYHKRLATVEPKAFHLAITTALAIRKEYQAATARYRAAKDAARRAK